MEKLYCKQCETDKYPAEFGKAKRTRTGKRPICKICLNSNQREYYKNNLKDAQECNKAYARKANFDKNLKNWKIIHKHLKSLTLPTIVWTAELAKTCSLPSHTPLTAMRFAHREGFFTGETGKIGNLRYWEIHELKAVK